MGLFKEIFTPSGRRKRRERRLDQAYLTRLAREYDAREAARIAQYPNDPARRNVARFLDEEY